MYQSFVYVETRIQLSPVNSVFITNDSTRKISIEPHVLQNVYTLAKALGCQILTISDVEKIIPQIPAVDNGKTINGYSVKIAENGTMNLLFHSHKKTVKIKEVRIEEDLGRLAHTNGITKMDYSCAGNPSIRIKTASSFELGEEVHIFLEELRRLTQYLNIENNELKDSYIRCNAYVALSKYPSLPDYYVKLRNLNSFNFARKAVNQELTRQENMLSAGEKVRSESRIWNEAKSCTEFYKVRTINRKRFENLTPPQTINLENEEKKLSAEIKIELPEARRQRLKKQYGISRLRSEFLCDTKEKADFFEKVCSFGANPVNTAHWIASELARLLNKANISISKSKVTPEHFAWIIKKLDTNEIHSFTAKQLLRSTFENGHSPERLMKSLNITELANEKDLLPFVKKVIKENPEQCKILQSGQMSPLEFLTGLVMKETEGRAVPQVVKTLIKEELNISVIYMITTGGAISAVRHQDGTVSAGDSSVLKNIAEQIAMETPLQVISAGQYLSEELEPKDWSELITEITARINAGTASGIIVTHGTYTLNYTSALLYWLFSDSDVPIVITASSTLPLESTEAEENLRLAIETASKEKKGVYVVLGGKILSPLNLHFDKPGSFSNWNLTKQKFTESGPVATLFSGITELDKDVVSRILSEASRKMFMCRLYPGFRTDLYNTMLKYSPVHSVFIEMYGIGSGNMNDSDYSLKPFLLEGNKRGMRFYCTSQQKIQLDFSQFVTAHGIWREGAVPMGCLTTESAIALYFACAICADSDAELDEIMENYAELYSN